MSRLLVLGARGMLGSMVSQIARQQNIEVVRISKDGDFNFRYSGNNLEELFRKFPLGPKDTLVNCIGWIPQKAKGANEDKETAYLLNSRLLSDINSFKGSLHFRWVQILTDCVYSGEQGGYLESAAKDAQDLYGLSKISGEAFAASAESVRCSIVGPDSSSNAGLYAWFRNNALDNKPMNGYVNAFWNGVSTLAFAKLVVGLHFERNFSVSFHHWIPDGVVSKFELLVMFATEMSLGTDLVKPQELPKIVNRTLKTLDEKKNADLWNLAGYERPPRIQELVHEFIVNREDEG